MESLWKELKRRNVFKAATSYAIVAWIVLQVADITFPKLLIPDWVLSLLIVLFLLGLPVVLFVSWAFELTPEGFKPAAEVNPAASITARAGQRFNHFILAGLVVAVGVMWLDVYVLTDDTAVVVASEVAAEPAVDAPAAPEIQELSIAVLPFNDLSSAQDQQHYADGISEELTNLLTRVDDMLVINTNSSFQFRDQEQNFATIRSVLKVNYQLTGSLQREGDELRLNVNLTHTGNGEQVWSERYARQVDDLFSVQQEIAEAVSTALQITLSAGQFGRIPGMTRNTEAYEEFLKASVSLRGGTVEDMRSALQHLELALQLDPEFTVASAQIYFIYKNVVPFAASAAQFPQRDIRAAEALMQIQSLDSDSLVLLGLKYTDAISNGQWLEASQHIAALDDSLATVGISATGGHNLDLGRFYLATGHAREALLFLELARASNPLDPLSYLYLSDVVAVSEGTERALALNAEALAAPNMQNHQLLLDNRLLTVLGMKDPALLDAYDYPLAVTDNSNINGVMMEARDDPARALLLLRELAEEPGLSIRQLLMMSAWATWFGDHELALELFYTKDGLVPFFQSIFLMHPVFSDMRKLDGFKQLVTDMGLVEYWRTTNNWSDYCRPVAESESDFECF